MKGYLKAYDNEFYRNFHRAPEKNEKLPLKDLYMYYKHLKNRIDARTRQVSASQGARAQSADSQMSMKYSQKETTASSGTTTPP